MDTIGELEFKVQVLARCLGSALGLGRPTRVQIHYCDPQTLNADKSGSVISPFDSQEVKGSQFRPLASVA